MPVPTPMLAASAREWSGETGWVMQPKWDGFRLLVDVNERGALRAYSRHGTNLTDRLGDLPDPLASLPAGTVIDGELVALADVGGRVVQDFAAVGHAALRGDPIAARSLHYVVFDVLALDGRDARPLPWSERDELLRSALPDTPRVRAVNTQPASQAGHEAIVALGFEGTVLKRSRSTYRPGRQRSWRKVKARHHATATVVRLTVAQDGRRYAACRLADGRSVTAAVHTAAPEPGQAVTVVYSRRDAGGQLREARVAAPAVDVVTPVP